MYAPVPFKSDMEANGRAGMPHRSNALVRHRSAVPSAPLLAGVGTLIGGSSKPVLVVLPVGLFPAWRRRVPYTSDSRCN